MTLEELLQTSDDVLAMRFELDRLNAFQARGWLSPAGVKRMEYVLWMIDHAEDPSMKDLEDHVKRLQSACEEMAAVGETIKEVTP